LRHAIFEPGKDGWLDEVDRVIEKDKPDSWKGYTVGDPLAPSKFPYRLDDEKLMYPFYERTLKAGIRNVCVHKGLLPSDYEKSFMDTWRYAMVEDVPQAAKDWPELNFIIYHSGYRFPGSGTPEDALQIFEQTGRIDWVTDLAEIPAQHGVTNVYGDLGQIFAMTTVAQPRLAAAIMGQLVRGLGHERVVWGTDAVWTGAPQWQIEALRRLEVPEDLQRKHGLPPLGAADGPVKSAIFGLNSARLYRYPVPAVDLPKDRLARRKADYEAAGAERSNLRYGYVAR
jgi:hypothetical protein